jgi:hypothetical protein
MFGLMKKAMVVAAVAGVAAAAPAVASADEWTNDSGASTFNGTAIATGSLTLSASGTTTTCDVRAELTLDNTGPVGGEGVGTVDVFDLGAPAGGSCSSTIPGCTNVSAVANNLPWAISTSGMDVTIDGVDFNNTYSGAGCPLTGALVNAIGSVTGTAVPTGTIVFNAAGPLTTSLGLATVSGTLGVEDTSGNPIDLL